MHPGHRVGTEPPVLPAGRPGEFTGRMGEEYRSGGAGTWCSSGAAAGAAQALQGRAYRCRVPQGQRAVRDDSARRATTFSTSRRIALLPGRMTNQYAAKARLVFGSVARTRVSVLNRVPA